MILSNTNIFSQKMYFFCTMISRVCIILLSLIFTDGKMFANVGVELDVSFRDTTVQCQFLHVLSPNMRGTYDTIAIFDSLSFKGQSRVSLFYSVDTIGENIVSVTDASGIVAESRFYNVSPKRTTFAVLIGQQNIRLINKDYIYPQKNDDERSYYIFLAIFFAVKILITTIFVFSLKLPKRIITISSGTFLLTAFIDWLLPLHYLSRFFIMMLAEYLLIAYAGRASISWLRTALLVLLVNVTGFGLITSLYIVFVFW